MIDVVHIVLAMKPVEGNFAQNAIEHGVAGINVDGCRVGTTVETWPDTRSYGTKAKKFNSAREQHARIEKTGDAPPGRWPANVIHDGSDEVKAEFPKSESLSRPHSYTRTTENTKYGKDLRPKGSRVEFENYGDSGSNARFFKECTRDDK